MSDPNIPRWSPKTGALSAGHRDSSREGFGGCHPAESLSRARIELRRHRIEMGVGMHRQVGALGKILAEQAVDVLVGAALPGTVRIAEVDLDRGVDIITS